MRLSSLLLGVTGLVQLAAAANSLMLAQYWPAYDGLDPANIHWKDTSIVYYFCLTTSSTGISLPSGQSTSDITKFVTDAHANGAKAIITVGGWDGGIYFSTLVKTAAARKKLAAAMLAFVDKYDADGIDLDWEYPGSQGIGCNKISSADSTHLLDFVKEARSLFGTKLITAAVSITPFAGTTGAPMTDVSSYAKYFDYLNIMTYDLVGTWDTYSSSASPLKTCGSDGSATSAVAAWTAAGFPAKQLLLGIPAYATSFTTLSSTLSTTTIDGYSTRIRQKISTTLPKGATGDSNAKYTDVCGVTSKSYSGQYNMKELISEGLLSSDELTGKAGYKRVWDTCTQTPFLFSATKKHFITYEDSKSVAQKVSWARKKGLAGVMIFDTTGFTTPVYQTIQSGLTTSVSKRHLNIGSLSHP